tara:strand:+ start:65 stop:403 length:339 start_codon:yes stop_codon:yes gene_type:complete
MKYISKSLSLEKTPTTSDQWRRISDFERTELIRGYLKSLKKNIEIEVVRADSDGQIIFKIEKPIAANERGMMLLDFENELKKNIDLGITVWLEPVGDKSKLRNLRGIKIRDV